jgi:hypothetical protein
MKKQIGLNVFLIHKNNHDNIKITFNITQSYIPVQFIKSFCCIEAEKRVKKKFVGTFNFNPRGKKGVL